MAQVTSHHLDKAAARAATELTKQEAIEAMIFEKLLELGGQRVSENSIEFGKKFVLPEEYKGDIEGAIQFLASYQEMMEAQTDFTRTYDFKPWDGARAVQNALRKNFGTIGNQRGPKMMGFFGSFDLKAQQRSIPIGPNKHENIPWGQFDIPLFRGKIRLDSIEHKEKGTLFFLVITAAKKYAAAVEGLFMLVQKELEEDSIYKGKAFDGQEEPEFLNVKRLNEKKVVYSDDVMLQLEANVWSFVKHAEILEAAGMDPKRAVLLEGPYGTGKTLAGMWTAKLAEKFGVTFILCRPQDNLHEAMGTARLYQPSIVFFEDIDKIATPDKPNAIEELLDTFDGMRSKGNRVMIVMTTNHKEKIHKGMLRPGRMDAIITISSLDEGGIKRFIETTLESGMFGQLDYAQIAKACEGYLPAYIKEVIQRAVMYSIARGQGTTSKLQTIDFVEAAKGLRAQYELMMGAAERTERPNIEAVIENVVKRALDKTPIVDEDGDGYTHLETMQETKN